MPRRIGNVESIYPLSPMQSGMVYHTLSAPATGVYVVQLDLELSGALDVKSLRQAWRHAMDRHPSLRTLFLVDRGKELLQVVVKEAPLLWREEDLRDLAEAEQDSRIALSLEEDRNRGFDLQRAPLFRLMLFRTGRARHRMVWTVHHAVMDGWSSPVLLSEVLEDYQKLRAGETPRTGAAPPYETYIDWLGSQDKTEAESYWRADLRGLRGPTSLPWDARPESRADRAHRTEEVWCRVPEEVTRSLTSMARAHHLTLNTVAQGAWAVLLSRYSGEDDVVYGVTDSGRPPSIAGIEAMVGCLVRTLPCRVEVDDSRVVQAWLRDLQLAQAEQREHGSVSLVELQGWSEAPPGTPLFETLFVYENYPTIQQSGDSNGLRVRHRGALDSTNYALSLLCGEVRGELHCRLMYDPSWLERSTVERMAGHLERLLSGIAEDPSRRLGELPLLTESERHQVVTVWNETTCEYPSNRCVHELFEEQVERTPDVVAVVYGDQTLTYSQLNKRANRLAHTLRGAGVRAEDLVGLCVERSLEMVVGLLGILKAGAAYVPLDPRFPQQRLAFMLGDSGVSTILTQEKLLASLPDGLSEGSTYTLCLDRDWSMYADAPDGTPACVTRPDHLGYAIYTSGSTGLPKGVLIEHRQLVNYVHGILPLLDLPPGSRYATVSTLAADLGNTMLLPPLCTGGTLHVMPESCVGAADSFTDYMRKHAIDCIKIVPSHLEALLAAASDAREVLPRRLLVLGGEMCDSGLVERVWELAPDCSVMNHYGPTETTVGVLTHRLPHAHCERFPVAPPIGRPIANSQVYILDAALEPVPVGVPGELYVGGAQVGRGYLSQPAQTAERFVPDGFGDRPGARLYGTGDVARYRWDGNVEFIGRVDDQVKVRGYRIELGEIETVLEQHAVVDQAVALVREDRPGDRRLTVYAVPSKGASLADSKVQEILRERLPAYMVPSSIVILEALPLTPNGKVDREVLPAPQRSLSPTGYVAARSETEAVLCSIWAELLGLERVGVHDNFFDLGGDSILSIQVVARARRAGIDLTPRQTFQHQTIAGLAQVAGVGVAMQALQGPLTGAVPLLPVQRWLFEQDLAQPEHFNNALLLQLRKSVAAEDLGAVLEGILERHDALRGRFVEVESGVWEQRIVEPGGEVPLTVMDPGGIPADERAAWIARHAEAVQSGFELSEGALFRAVLFGGGGGESDRLLLVAHHLVIDAVSWRVLLEDLERGLSQRQRGEPVVLGAKTSSIRQWSERLIEYGGTPELLNTARYWQDLPWSRARPVPVDDASGANTADSSSSVLVTLSEDETRALLQEVPGAYHTQINDVLLTAMWRALSDWTGSSRVALTVEGHGREDVFEGIDLSQTVGWFTTIFPMLLEVSGDWDPGQALRSIKEQLRSVPHRGLDYGVARYLSGDEALRASLSELPRSEVSFNYLGQFDEASSAPPGEPWWVLAPDSPGSLQGRGNVRPRLLDVTGIVSGGKLGVRWIYSRNLHRRETIEGVASRFLGCLRELIDHGCSQEVSRYTPSDFPRAALDQRALDGLVESVRGVAEPETRNLRLASVYPLSPMQSGMVYHTLSAPATGLYVVQLDLELSGALDVESLRQAWRHAMDRHPTLRTLFVVDRGEELLQVVVEEAPLPWSEEDLRDLAEAEQDSRMASYLDRDRKRGFDLQRAPLFRLMLFRTGQARHRMVWTVHHAVIDGWSNPVLLSEVWEGYERLRAGEAPQPGGAAPYETYIDWLESRDLNRAESYWRAALRGLRGPTSLPWDARPETRADRAHGTEAVWCRVPEEVTRSLTSMARAHRLTLNTVVQGAWAVLLSRYSGEDDVVYGVTDSGRPPSIPGIEEMVGCLVRTLPCRVEVDGSRRVHAWLRDLQSAQVEREEHGSVSLVELHGWSEVPSGTPLFETLFVYENYPTVKQSEDANRLRVGLRGGSESANYALSLLCGDARGELHCRLMYDPSWLERSTVERMGGHLVRLLEEVASDPSRRVSELSVLSDAERHQLLVAWNDTAETHPDDKCIHELFEEQVERAPDAVAVVFRDQTLTYGQLNERANRVAHTLRGMGVGVEDLVGLCVERSLEMVVGLLGILKAGGAYVPLDPDYPRQRLAFMLEDSGVSVLLTEEPLLPALPKTRPTVVCLDRDWPAISGTPAMDPAPQANSGNVAYVIYTSGSTGTPKGVVVTHRSLVNDFTWVHKSVSIGARDCVTQFASLAFDMSAWQLFVPLLAGARVLLPPPGKNMDPVRLWELMRRHAATILSGVPSFLQSLLGDSGSCSCPSLRLAVSGGETLSGEIARRLVDQLGVSVLNMYGPTEATIEATSHQYRKSEDYAVPIGRPIANATVYALDHGLDPLFIGAKGELYVGGAGVARGYLNDPTHTAERFMPNPFSNVAGDRMYRTGDAVRWTSEGTLEFLGRVDDQVKLRGYRIELGEIESVLEQHAAVDRAVALLRDDCAGDRRLVAYAVPRKGSSLPTSEIRGFAKERLPAYMVPSSFVTLETLPLTPNGKVDRKALPVPDLRDQAGSFVAPRNGTEEALCAIWGEVLGIDRVGVHDDFFELGGHSLLATRLVSRIRRTLEREVPLREIFEHPTVAELGGKLAEVTREIEIPPLLPVAREGDLPLSFAQERLWFLDQMKVGSAYHMPLALRLRGELDEPSLRRSLEALIDRHETLRTSFPSLQDGRPVQRIADAIELPLRRIDLSELASGERDREARRVVEEEVRRTFDLSLGPLVRWLLVRLSEADHVLVLTMHHIVSDGWSMGVLFREWTVLYEASCRGEGSPLSEPAVQYGDYTIWQREWLSGEVLDAQLSYWREQLADVPMLELPADRPRPAVQTYEGGVHAIALAPEVSAGLRRVCCEEGVTLAMVLLGAWQVLLGRYAGQDDVAVGMPIANRRDVGLEGLIGFFVNTLVLRTDLGGAPTFRELLGRIREVSLSAYAHQDVPFEQVVEALNPERALSHHPLLQVAFAMQNAPREALRLGGLEVERFGLERVATRLDLELHLTEAGRDVVGQLIYNVALFEKETIERMAGHLQHLLSEIVEDPSRRASELSPLREEERHQLLVEWNDTAVAYPDDKCIHELFEEQVERAPDAVAAVFGDESLTYGQLNKRANQLAHTLRDMGVGVENLVGLCVERSLAMVVGLLGILKAGGAYVPLDPEYPRQRLGFMLEDSGVSVLLTQASLLETLPDRSVEVLCMDRDASAIGHTRSTNPSPLATPDNLAYVIYTSGSTGRPKAVLLAHRGLCNVSREQTRAFCVEPMSRILQFASISFDAATAEIVMALAKGAALFLGSRETLLPGPDLLRFLRRHAITFVTLPPSALGVLPVEPLPDLSTITVAGEACPAELVSRWASGRRFFNLYGPTEATIWSTMAKLQATAGAPHIGHPIGNTRVYVLDDRMGLVPVGVPGELYIGGVGLGRGYHRRPDLTAERFMPDPYATEPGERLYRTGDLARYSADGSIEFLGRADHQVKLRGYRIELGEIESVMREHPGVRQAVAEVHEDEGRRLLVAYLVCEPREIARYDEASAEAYQSEHLSDWNKLFGRIYGERAEEVDPTFNIAGWNSSYTGRPIPADEMRTWVDSTVDRILERAPEHVMEIGCGTGLLLFRVAPRTTRYLGTDFSDEALGYVGRHCSGRIPEATTLRLERRRADEFEGIEARSFDTVILNSVVQYFPDVDYLVRVLEGAVEAVTDGGVVFVGDVRNLKLLETFHASIRCHKIAESVPCRELREQFRQELAREKELVVDPTFFHEIARRSPRISHLEVRPKRGEAHNELTKFRYDVLLHIGAPGPTREVPWIDWRDDRPSAAVLEAQLRARQPDVLGVRAVPNARTLGDAFVWLQLRDRAEEVSLEELRAEARRLEREEGVEPEEWWALEERIPYDVRLSWASAAEDGSYDVLFVRRGAGEVRLPIRDVGSRPWPAYANAPLWSRLSEELVPRVRAHVESQVPEYMVPTSFVILDSLPLTPSGKVDRKALPAPQRSLDSAGYVAARNGTEEVLCSVWAELLGVDRVGVHDDFFELGGHSLLATQLVSRIRRTLEREVALREIFEHRTVSELGARLAEIGSEIEIPPLLPVAREGDLPLSFAQERLWFLDQLEAGPAYHMPLALRLRGELDEPSLRRALEALIARHETLRTSFPSMEDGRAVQQIADAIELPLRRIDLSALARGEREREARHVVAEEVRRGFDLSRGPLVRWLLVRLAEAEHVLVMTMHHIVSDGWSMGVLLREWTVLYEASCRGEPSPLAEPAVQYGDYTIWQRAWLSGEVLDAQLSYWREQLKDVPVLELPADRPRPAVQTFEGGVRAFAVAPEVSAGLRKLCREEGVTLAMVLLGAWQVLLGRYAGQDDVAVGMPIANRRHGELEDLIGFFVNTLVLQTDLSGDPSFEEVVRQVKEASLSAYAHQDVPFEQVVEALNPERALSHHPLFQVLFAMQNAPREELRLGGLEVAPFGPTGVTTRFDLELHLTEVGPDLMGRLVYNVALFEKETIERTVGHLQRLLSEIAEDPTRRLSELPLLSESERHQVVTVWNDTATDYPSDGCVHELFEEQAARTPDATAVSCGANELTYGELNIRANQLAHHLRFLGVGLEVRVGLYLDRGVEMVVAILGILKAGGAYMPLASEDPTNRLAFMLKDARPSVVLTQSHLRSTLSTSEAIVIELDRAWSSMARNPTDNVRSESTAEDLAYVMYTSGSTGRPKGTAVVHRGVVRLVRSANYTSLGPDEVFLQLAPISFDASTLELWGPLLNGGKVVILPPGRPSLRELAEAIRDGEITSLWLTAALFHQMVDEELESLCGVRQLLAGGDVLSVSHVRRVLDALPETARLVNGYGPTENTTFTCCHVMSPGSEFGETVPIGRPIANTRVYVLDRGLQPVPTGVPGELYAGGDGLARGYWDRPDLTAERFVPDPFATEPGQRLYRTGDLARYQPDGAIEFLGRRDHQVKVSGYRIELGEIESVLQEHPEVRQVVVVAREDTLGTNSIKWLVAYVGAEEGGSPGHAELRTFLTERLPDYMVPSAIVLLEAFPLTASGKVDRMALPAPSRSLAPTGYVAARNGTEEVLCAIWSELLGLERVGVHDNFFDVGGDSILSIQVVARATRAGIELTPRQMFEHQTIAELAVVSGASVEMEVAQGPLTGAVPLLPVQRWLFEQELAEPAHFNQAVLLGMRRSVAAEDLGPVLEAILERHDVLRGRFVEVEPGVWEQRIAESGGEVPLSVMDPKGVPADERAAWIERHAEEVQSGFDLAEGSLFWAVLFGGGDGESDRLLLVAHHLVIDGVSWRVLLEDLERGLSQRRRGEPVDLGAKTSSIRQWSERLLEYGGTPELREAARYWQGLPWSEARPLPVDDASGSNTVGSSSSVTVTLSEDETRSLLQEVPRAYNTQINDVLLTAMWRALSDWTGSSRVVLTVEGHGREDVFEGIDLSQTVGWFTSIFPVVLEVSGGWDPGEALRSIKEQLRSVPHRGLDYGVARYLSGDEELRDSLSGLSRSEVSFNYLGQFGAVSSARSGESWWVPVSESAGSPQGPRNVRRHVLDVGGMVSGGELVLQWTYSRNLHHRETIERVASRFLGCLRELIDHCSSQEVSRYTPSDFPRARLDQRGLDQIMERVVGTSSASEDDHA